MSDASPPWWEAFFDEEYLLLYGPALHAVRTEEEVRGLVELQRLADGARVLDLCCGDGRHAVALQRRGLRVTGVDVAMALLKRARARRERVLGGPTRRCAAPGPAASGSGWTYPTSVLTERWIDPVEGVAHAVFRFARDGVEVEKVFRHRLYTPGELRALLAQAGFTSLALYGGYDRRPFSLDAPQLVAHCRA